MKRVLIFLFLPALVLRLLLVFSAFHSDLNNNISWGTVAVELGVGDFYRDWISEKQGMDWPYSAPNQPPLFILTFAAVKLIWLDVEKVLWWLNNNFRIFPSPLIWFWEGQGMTLLVKLPSVLADLGIGWMIYQYMKRKKKEALGLKLSAVWLFNPVVWYNSSVWGQTDAVVNLLALAGVLFLQERRFVFSTAFFVLSFLFKGSLLIFAPILLAVIFWQGYKIWEWIKAIVISIFLILVSSIWFHPEANFFSWFVDLYKTRILPGEIGNLSANAFNFWILIKSGNPLDWTIYLGLPARTWGFGIFVVGIVFIVLRLKKRFSDKTLFYSLAITAVLAFLFLTRVHERYLYPFFPYATILLGLVPGMFVPYFVLSTTHLLNLYHLFWAPPFSALEALYKTSWFIPILSLINIGTFFWLLGLGRRFKV